MKPFCKLVLMSWTLASLACGGSSNTDTSGDQPSQGSSSSFAGQVSSAAVTTSSGTIHGSSQAGSGSTTSYALASSGSATGSSSSHAAASSASITVTSTSHAATSSATSLAGGFVILEPLQLDHNTVQAGDRLSGTVTYKNNSSSPLSIQAVTIAARPPGGTHAGGPYQDLAPSLGATTVPAGGTVSLTAIRTFTQSDAAGQWESYPTYRDASGTWHDGPSVFFTVTAGQCEPRSCEQQGKNCGTISNLCGGSLECGVCTSPATCAGGGIPNVCGTGGSSSMKLGVNFWNKSWGNGWRDYFVDNVDWNSVTNPWKPEFLADLAPYTTLRFMDWVPANNSNVVDWSERKLKTADHYSGAPVAYEWMVDLCNRTGKDMWITLPHKSNENYWRQLATLIRDTLDPARKVYVEYSNETWNGGFQQFQYCIDQGVSLGLPGSNQWYQGGAFSVYQSLKIFKTFRDVFGNQMSSRVVRVLAYSGNEDIFDKGYNNVVNSSQWNPDNETADMIAVAPYINGDIDGASATARSEFHDEIDRMNAGYVAKAVEIASRYGKPLGCYEGGQHLLKNAQVWSRNPLIYEEYRYMLDTWKPHFSLFMHYTQYGTFGSGGAWGAKESVEQPLSEAHKYRAIVDWVNSN